MGHKSGQDTEKWEKERYSEFAAWHDFNDWWPVAVSVR
jgi:hypothetical protein